MVHATLVMVQPTSSQRLFMATCAHAYAHAYSIINLDQLIVEVRLWSFVNIQDYKLKGKTYSEKLYSSLNFSKLLITLSYHPSYCKKLVLLGCVRV